METGAKGSGDRRKSRGTEARQGSGRATQRRYVRAQAIRLINDRLRDIETIFDREHQFDDYARKLFLIENCIYGVDIQPIARRSASCAVSLR
jgi:hypothetical protein